MFAKRKIIVATVLAFLFCVNGAVFGTTYYYVDPDGNDLDNGLTWATAFATIQKGIDTATDFNVVEVNEGTYYGTVDFKGYSCTLQSTNPNDWGVVAATIIDCNSSASTVVFKTSEDANSVIRGFTITGASGGGPANQDKGNGIYCPGSSPTITDCNVTGNTYRGIYCVSSSSVTISSCIIHDNNDRGIGGLNSSGTITDCTISSHGFYGIGFEGTSSTPTITDCNIINNSDYGIYCPSGGSPTITNCIIRDNNDSDGGDLFGTQGYGIYFHSGTSVSEVNECTIRNSNQGIKINSSSASPTIKNCLIYDNSDYGVYSNSSSASILNCTIVRNSDAGIYGSCGDVKNCILWDNNDDLYNASATYCCIENGDPGTGNNAYFPYFEDSDNNDFHLDSNSPCIDAGDPSSDYSKEPAPNGGRINMGAYGNTTGATSSSDTDGDGMKNSWESANYLNPNDAGDAETDLDSDGINNIVEYYLNWDPNSDDSGSIDGYITNTTNDYNYPSIGKAIALASNADVVILDANTFYENINFSGKEVRVRSTDPNNSNVVASTVIDANDNSDVDTVFFNSGEDSNSVLDGVTIRGGYNGILCENNSSPKLIKCVISDNIHRGIRANSSEPLITQCTVSDNNDRGVAFDGSSSSPTISRCTIKEHGSYGIWSNGSATISNCIIHNCNYGIRCTSGSPTIKNCTIVDNNDSGDKGIWGSSSTTIINCILWDNANDLDNCEATYSCIQDCNDANGVGNICGDSNNPDFVNADANNFHLDCNSHCINRGDPNGDYTGEVDIDGDTREQGGRVDMGADETAYRVHNIDKGKWYTTIQSAINDSNYGNEIEVHPDTYQGTIEFIGHTCKLRSTDPYDRDVVEATIIAGQAEFIENDSNASLAGFTVRGIVCSEYSDPNISNCIIKNNENNGVTINSSSPRIINCEIYDNNYGFRIDGGSPEITNDTIAYNTSYGIYCVGSGGSPVITNCIIWGHDANDIDPNFSATYSCIQDCSDASGTGNICGDANDPNFVDDPNDNYLLNAGSPCIDDANGNVDPTKDMFGNSRYDDPSTSNTGVGDPNYVDMGAHEYQG